MSTTLVILINELKVTLKRKGFIISSLALPAVAILAILILNIVNAIAKPPAETLRLGYVDQAGIFSQYTEQNGIQLEPYSSIEQANADLTADKIKEYFVIPADYLATGQITRYSLQNSLEPPNNTLQATRNFLISNLVEDKLSPDIADRIKSPMILSSVVLDKTGKVADGQGGFGGFALSYIFGLLLLMSIFTASGYLLQSLSEEKENRIMEVLLSSVSTRQLITGKVLGLGAAGLIQMIFWLLSAWGLIALASSSIGGFFGTLQFPASVIILSLVYFILGYLIFAILMAGTGAIAPTARDGQQLSMVFSLLASIPFILMMFIIENGDHIVNIILTLFPITAPITVMMRLNAGIPTWELAVSIFILVISIIGLIWLTSRLFRIYLLMYGKTPGWREILKTLRQG